MGILKLLLRIVLGVVLAVIVLVAGLAARGAWMLQRTHSRPLPALAVPSDPAAVERGRYVAATRCTGCHSDGGSLPLSGGRGFHMGPVADLYPANLTPGGVLARYSDAELARAVREGITREGKAMLIMPSKAFRDMSDTDLGALIAYMRTQPAVAHADSAHHYGLLGLVLVGAGQFPISVQPALTAPVPEIAPAAGLAYGKYVATMSGCIECHTATLHGGQLGPPDVAHIARTRSFDEFDGAVRRGRAVEGRPLSDAMPWRTFANLSDQDVQAIYEYARSLP